MWTMNSHGWLVTQFVFVKVYLLVFSPTTLLTTANIKFFDVTKVKVYTQDSEVIFRTATTNGMHEKIMHSTQFFFPTHTMLCISLHK